MRKKIVLITSGQPSINPRLVKEADALAGAGYDVTVIYQYWNEWATEADKVLLCKKTWNFICVGGSPKNNKFTYLFTRITHRLFRKLSDIIGLRFYIAELAICRSSILLLRCALQVDAELYIGHTPGAIAIACIAAKRKRVKCGFDAEDFHRYEYSDDDNHLDVKTKKYLEEQYFPQYDYLITASPLITKEYLTYFSTLTFKTVLNVFEKTPVNVPVKTSSADKPLRLFWFSQTVGHNRGLEDIINAIALCQSTNIELHILGNPREKVVKSIYDLATKYHFPDNQIQFYNPIPPDEIFALAAHFDLGMATEIGAPYNRDICLTNKIFTYLQSGLAIIASDTTSQHNFIKENPGSGLLYQRGNIESLGLQIKRLYEDRTLLNNIKQQNFNLGQTVFNWETESKKFLGIVENILQ